jgi:hypothetical protein
MGTLQDAGHFCLEGDFSYVIQSLNFFEKEEEEEAFETVGLSILSTLYPWPPQTGSQGSSIQWLPRAPPPPPQGIHTAAWTVPRAVRIELR